MDPLLACVLGCVLAGVLAGVDVDCTGIDRAAGQNSSLDRKYRARPMLAGTRTSTAVQSEVGAKPPDVVWPVQFFRPLNLIDICIQNLASEM